MRWFVVTAAVALVLAPMAVSSQRVPSQQLIELAIGRIPAIADSSPKLWGMSGMEMIYVRQAAGSLTPAMRTEMYDARTVEKVVRLIDLSEYKRRQAAPGLKVTSKAFGVGRRIPIAQCYREI